MNAFIGLNREVISVNSGTSALNLAFSCLNLGPGDEVIVPSLTYVASYQAIATCGATPVSCDVELKTGFICPKAAEKLITKRTKAIMPVHYASQSEGIDYIRWRSATTCELSKMLLMHLAVRTKENESVVLET